MRQARDGLRLAGEPLARLTRRDGAPADVTFDGDQPVESEQLEQVGDDQYPKPS
jgi:hypothetical protein